MKKHVIIILMMMCGITLTAQTTVFSDNFNSYEAGTDLLAAPSEFITTTLGIAATVEAADAPGNNGSQFVKIVPNNLALNFRSPSITVVAGKPYVYVAKTYVPAAKNRTLQITLASGGASFKSSEVISSVTTWTETSLSFTPTELQTAIRLVFYSGASKTIDLYVDDMLLYDDSSTPIASVNESGLKVVKNMLNNEYCIISTADVTGYVLYNCNGQVIKHAKSLNDKMVSLNFSNLSKGV
ncbi:MAG: hypothetical protein WC341_06420, partial [Bacteroidales bacterium]